MKKKVFLFIILAVMLVLPTKVFALTDDEIKDKKEITLKSVPITNEDSLFQANENLYDETGYQLIDCNSTYTTCAVYKGVDETDVVAINVAIKYEYDEDVKRVVDGILEDYPNEGKQFYIEDIYMLRWILDQVELDKVDDQNDGINPIKYSTEFNNFIGYNNFFFEPRMGEDTMYANFAEGTVQFKYDGTIYGYGHMATRVNHILYVNDNETDIEGALKTRLSKYFNIDKIVKDPDVTIDDLINDELDMYRQDYNDCVTQKNLEQELATLEQQLSDLEAMPDNEKDDAWITTRDNKQNERDNKYNEIEALGYYGPTDLDEQYASADAYANAMKEEITDANNIDALWNIKSKVLPNVYVVYFTDGGDELSSGIPVFVAKDSSKVVTEDLEVKTRDVKSGITISNVGTSKKLPFDTLIKVSKLTSGTDYEKVVKALESLLDNKDNLEMFDLKLFSNALENYITKLDDGSFKVKIPLNGKLKEAASLIAYYVDENNKVHEYPITFEIIDGVRHAVFTTDHFSIYTLAEKEAEPEPTYKLTYDFNGGSRQGEKEYVDETVGFGMDITKANLIDKLGVTAPEGKEIDAIEINGVRTEFDDVYIVNKDTTFKYIWKDIANEEEALPDKTDSEKVPQTFDNITTYIIMLIISIIALVGVIFVNRKKIIKNK